MRIAKLLNPKLDYVFKRIFGSKGSEEITKDFLRAVTKENITKIELDLYLLFFSQKIHKKFSKKY